MSGSSCEDAYSQLLPSDWLQFAKPVLRASAAQPHDIQTTAPEHEIPHQHHNNGFRIRSCWRYVLSIAPSDQGESLGAVEGVEAGQWHENSECTTGTTDQESTHETTTEPADFYYTTWRYWERFKPTKRCWHSYRCAVQRMRQPAPPLTNHHPNDTLETSITQQPSKSPNYNLDRPKLPEPYRLFRPLLRNLPKAPPSPPQTPSPTYHTLPNHRMPTVTN